MNHLRKKVDKSSLYTDYVSIMNGVLRLPNRASEVLSYLLSINNALGSDELVIDKYVRSDVRQKFGLSESNLSHLFKQLKEKDLIVKGDKGLIINRSIVPEIKDGVVNVVFTLDTNAD
jgi:AraC-like DNA-binding protein